MALPNDGAGKTLYATRDKAREARYQVSATPAQKAAFDQSGSGH